ncbi:hypothetical protein BC834DRAFT_969775 [Gloeopeniophorella convolvens]|nr:hypothetical protein BC834DRAFT_969775 [Gloeopeniophorella convolvens]
MHAAMGTAATPAHSRVKVLRDDLTYHEPRRRDPMRKERDASSEAASRLFVQAIHAHVASVPPKTLQAYVLAQLPTTPQDALPVLAAFFTALTPPPLLHCARCHADYTDVENNDRACCVGHDDDDPEIERVWGRYSEYQTRWGCCDQTVEGDDGDEPDGWCYEGMHTTDRRDARFRADADSDDDKLVSCRRRKCRNIPARPPRASGGAKRARRPPVIDSTDDDDDDDDTGSEDTDVVEIVSDVGPLRDKAKGTGTDKDKARVAKPRVPAQQAEGSAGGSKTGSVSAPAPLKRRKITGRKITSSAA